MGKPVRRIGFFGTMPENPYFAVFAAFLGTNTPLTVYFRHNSDGHKENRPLTIRSIERREHPNPHIVRGTLEIDMNRPGQDSGDSTINIEVVLELWGYPETLVYLASEYVQMSWTTFENIVSGSIFKVAKDDGGEITYRKIDENNCFKVKYVDASGLWIPSRKLQKFYGVADALEVIPRNV